jgi:hypothetical protein
MTFTDDPTPALAGRDQAQLLREHQVLMRHYAEAQQRCTALLRSQAEAIEALSAQAVRLRADVILRDTALAWAREDRHLLEAAVPGLPRRVALARQVDVMAGRIQDLLRELPHMRRRNAAAQDAAAMAADDPPGLEASLRDADLVICQTGCLSHGAYWRVQDHCARTGKTCVVVERPEQLRIVHVHRAGRPAGASISPTLREVPVP